ncbi:hypothetical protein TSAR_003241 [Trichomalopsis sarcophagae]|uniref:Peptidase aspartic putative domain-containing protein n=1 Tax=Trichomalopsis sarcophagae TaxID=543379 RepID=A0A232EG32_9HYME|nr:hypothetical protein TSAR_003241 [Trichomalopsis sarcophagae]
MVLPGPLQGRPDKENRDTASGRRSTTDRNASNTDKGKDQTQPSGANSLVEFTEALKETLNTVRDAAFGGRGSGYCACASLALNSLGLTSYLDSHELLKNVASKIPFELKSAYNRYARTIVSNAKPLEKLSEFLREEAECAMGSGLLELEAAPSTYGGKSNVTRKQDRSGKTAIVCATLEETLKESHNRKSEVCGHCKRAGHEIRDCKEFAKELYKRKMFLTRQLRLCYLCLRRGHRRPQYNATSRCDFCRKKRHTMLHFEKQQRLTDVRQAPRQGLLRIVPIVVNGPGGSANAFALLDSGSTISMIDEDLARRVGLRGEKLEMAVRDLWDDEVRVKCERPRKIEHAIALSKLELRAQSLPTELTRELRSREKVNFEPYTNARPLILLGQDNWHLIAIEETRPIGDGGAVLSRSALGWTVHGFLMKDRQQLDVAPAAGKKKISDAERILEQTSRKIGKEWENLMYSFTMGKFQVVHKKFDKFEKIKKFERFEKRALTEITCVKSTQPRKGDDLKVLSCTDKKCGWKQDHSKALEEYDAAPLIQHSCFAEPAVKTKKIVNASSIKRCLEPE